MNITKPEIFTNLGGIFPIFLIPISEIYNISDLILGEISEITFKNSEFTPLYISTIQESSNLDEKQNAIDDFEYTLSAVISKNSLYYRNILEALNTDKHICIIPDANNNFRIIGDLENGAILTADSETGTKVSDLNNIPIQLKWQSNYRAAYTDLYKTFIMKYADDIAIQPYISTIEDISLIENSVGTFEIDGNFFDENMTISLGNFTVVTSYDVTDTKIVVHYITSRVETTPISIKRGGYEHFGMTPNIVVNERLHGSGIDGEFITDMETYIEPNRPWSWGWSHAVYGQINSIDDYFAINPETSGTPSNSTGPSAGVDGKYCFLETSNPNNGVGQYGEAFTSNFSILQNISFKYHRYGSGLGDFVIYGLDAEFNWIEIFRLAGEQQSSSSDPWLTANIDTSNLQIKSIRFTFEAATSFKGDMAIDNIILTSI